MKFIFNKKAFNLLKFVGILVFLENTQPKELILHKHFFKKYNGIWGFDSFYETNQLINILIKLFFSLENLIPILHKQNHQFSTTSLYKILKKFFKKITNVIKFSEKTPSKDFKYFWIFKKRGYYWRRNYIFYKTNKIETLTDYKLSKFFLKANLIKKLKFFWSFNKKLNMPLNIAEVPRRVKTIKKKKIYWVQWRTLLQHCFYKTLQHPHHYRIFQATTHLILIFFMLSSLKLFYKNFRGIRVRENSYVFIRKRFSAYYVFRTFEYAYHKYWNTYKYDNLLNFFNNFFNNGVDNALTLPLSEEVQIPKQKLGFFVFLFKNIMWKKQRKVVTKDDRGYFAWERRHFKKRRKFKKIFLIKTILNRSFFFKDNFFTFGVVDLLHNLNKSSPTPFNYVFDNSLIKSGELVGNFFSLKFFDENCAKKKIFSNFKKKWVLSNYNPILLLPKSVKKILLKKKILLTNFVNHKYLQFYLNNFINHYSNMKAFFIFSSNSNTFNEDFANKYLYLSNEIVHLFKKLNKKFFKKFFLSKFIEFFSFSLFKKDLSFFIKFFKLILENTFLKKHKKILYAFEFILKKFLNKIFFYTNVKGFKFEIAGKISVTGNSKTRKKIIKYGAYSLTNKSLKINYTQDIIRTSTGVLGIKTYLTY